MSQEQQKNNYGSSSIKVLKGLEPVRVRPGMYIGTTDSRGLHHLIWELIDNAVDEALAGVADQITLTVRKSGAISVEDNGRGIPTELHSDTGLSTVETVFTVLHAGGKFDNETYKVSGGLHGVGASVVNALAKYLKVWVKREGKLHYAEFGDGGQIKKKLAVIGDAEGNGTRVEFFPDFSIMEQHDWDVEIIAARLQRMAYLNKGLKLILVDERSLEPEIREWIYQGGIRQYVEDLNHDKEPLVPAVVYVEKDAKLKSAAGDGTKENSVRVECAMQWNRSYVPSVYSFCNNIMTSEGGTHEEGFKDAVPRIGNRMVIEKKFMKKGDEPLSREDVLEGLTAVISVKHSNPQYEGQTKAKLGNSEVRRFVSEVVGEAFERFLLENPDFAESILKKFVSANLSRLKSQEIRDATRRKSPFESGGLPGKLADCSNRDPSVCELYLVEGDSAGGSAKLGRDREYQAILPLRGKVINVEKAQTDKIFANKEILAMVTAIGASVGNEFDISKLRYDRIIIMTDADVDGAHIRILLLTFFFRYMKPLIEQGHVYIAQAPLYKITKGKKEVYCYSDAELEAIKKESGEGKVSIQRYKGLGEMNPQQLWETTMDPTTRSLMAVRIEDALLADLTFTELMGDEVAPRKAFIDKNAANVRNIDV